MVAMEDLLDAAVQCGILWSEPVCACRSEAGSEPPVVY